MQSEKIKTLSQFVADNENKLADAARKADEARQALAKAAARLARTKLYAPIDGVVQQIAVTTVGQVVTTGQQLVVVTPTDGPLQVEALVANLDIGFVKPGQDAAIKVDAFPFTRFGVLHGKVVKIASEAVAEQEAKRALANATASANAASARRQRAGPARKLRLPGHRRARRERDEHRRRDDSAHAGHDGYGRDQDRQPPGDRLSAFAARQGRFRGVQGEMTGARLLAVPSSKKPIACIRFSNSALISSAERSSLAPRPPPRASECVHQVRATRFAGSRSGNRTSNSDPQRQHQAEAAFATIVNDRAGALFGASCLVRNSDLRLGCEGASILVNRTECGPGLRRGR